ncbi:biotin--[acetyl-CoA-carboxylase] ligase [Rudaeicoccus suwonensis]|uniref:biotin--[biotin carboxyl-carrier protein] ligase n=1 Tax=Rudaeicoccus suwonensis TaxID=657409 RepID=A0A561E8Y6_9MICO|nr:biotin--[acetyl-CoA-carboxylase] ligase [Rudaeicoccus suwonensis]TWE12088.1 biotin-[acetyl-CoA-carboxylase] ligase BirA-like protein [Rudaeicoccus suwonensis]
MSHYLDRGEMTHRLADSKWREVDVSPQVGSTNAELLADPRPWRALITDHQTEGRGRMDRDWVAPSGVSVAMSATLPLPGDPTRWGWVPLLVGAAVRRALRRLTPTEISLKWPNDVLARSGPGQDWGKLAGILCTATGGEQPTVVVGIGINVHQSLEQLPVPTATSLKLCGADLRCEDIVVEILRELERVSGEWASPAGDDAYRAACLTIGQQVRVELAGDEVATGRAIDVDVMGRLLVDTAEGLVPHAAGDVVHVRPAAARLREEPEPAPVPQDRAAFVDALEARLLGGPRSLRRAEVAAATGVTPEQTRRFWRAMGFVNAREEDVAFTEADVQALRTVESVIANGQLDETTSLGLARAVGRSTDRLAMWSLQLITDMMSGDQGLGVDSGIAQVSAERAVELADDLAPLITYVWRRNLAVAISRMIADSEPESHIGVVRTVGFADLVSFTQLVRQLSERELATLVLRFESLASDVVSTHGGAVVKTVGDEVLFSHTSVEGAARIAFDLLDQAAADDLIPRMRVGLATGRVLARLGDIYGTTVNRASRLTTAADPGTVLADSDVAAALEGSPQVHAVAREEISLPGIGTITPWVLSNRGGQLLSAP